MLTPAMRKLEFFILDLDIDRALEYLGKTGCFELDLRSASGKSRDQNDREAREALLEASAWLGTDINVWVTALTPLPKEADYLRAHEIASQARTLAAEEKALADAFSVLDAACREADAFSGLDVPFSSIDSLSFLAFRIGTLEPGQIPLVRETLGERAVILELANPGQVIAASSKKAHFALDTELGKAGFKASEIDASVHGIPAGALAALKEKKDAAGVALREFALGKSTAAGQYNPEIRDLLARFDMGSMIETAKDGLEASARSYRVVGWTPKAEARRLVTGLNAITQGRIAARIFRPEEMASVNSGSERVPVRLRHGAFIRSFEGLVCSYGTPLYGTIDPTPFVAFFFILLFSIMFGDVGQGFIIFLSGLFLAKAKKSPFPKWSKFAPAFMASGAGSMVFGFLDGSVFANEKLLVPLTRFLSGFLFGVEKERFVEIMPVNGVGKLFMFFGFTVAIGVAINSIGLLINIYNNLKLKRWENAFFAKTGIAGAVFFWWAISMGIRAMVGSMPSWFDIPGLGIPLCFVFFGDPLGRIIEGHSPVFENGILAFVIKGIVEIIESVSYYFSGTMSFLRVGAFALSHAVLSFIVFEMGDLLRAQGPFGLLFEIIVVIIGNLVIITLEGLIVAIQTVRLQYYEFFSKFFVESGRSFEPFNFGIDKESQGE